MGSQAIPLIIKSAKESLDIDTEDDFEYAEFLISNTQQASKNVGFLK